MSLREIAFYWREKGLSTRASWILAMAGLTTPEAVRAVGRNGLMRLENCGPKTTDEILKCVADPQPSKDGMELRVTALVEAVAVCGGDRDPERVLSAARAFHAWLTGTEGEG